MKHVIAVILLLFAFCAHGQEPIRGVWMTNVGSRVLYSRDSIVRAVDQCKMQGINSIFVVVWNKGLTMYPSAVVKQYIGIEQDPLFAGRDPIQELIDVAHAQSIKVHAWFEFGFSFGYRDTTSLWVKRYPEWIGRDWSGKVLQKNGFYWWNALHPGPQQLLKELMLEVVQKYAVDGVQGDDRLPAMPAEGGWDTFTRELYRTSTGRDLPFNTPSDSTFLQWKADRLSAFGKEVYQSVKKIRPSCIVSWAPSIYPWSKEQYLQDWPKWLNGGYADYVFPQLYRYKLDAYEKIVVELSTQVPLSLKHKVFPGVLVSLGDGYQASEEMLNGMIQLNRKYGFNGEVFFYYETLNRYKKQIYQ
jgi:uncharacterized lipoprotein YddW (UPF0748 family)